MKTFEAILQEMYGTEDEMRYILSRLADNDVKQAVEKYAGQVAQKAITNHLDDHCTMAVEKGVRDIIKGVLKRSGLQIKFNQMSFHDEAYLQLESIKSELSDLIFNQINHKIKS